jgi:twitching motility protein PilT
LHIVAGSPPALRIDGKIARVKTDPLTVEEARKICYSIMTDTQKSEFEERKEIDFSFGVKNMARFRVNIFYQRGAVSGVFRKIALEIPDLLSLNLPKSVETTVDHPNGLVLVTGPTGSGKSTTIAGLIDKYNKEKRGHIITLEDPIEYVHGHKTCIVNQREIGADSDSYMSALKYILRQDPGTHYCRNRSPGFCDSSYQFCSGHDQPYREFIWWNPARSSQNPAQFCIECSDCTKVSSRKTWWSNLSFRSDGFNSKH